MSPTAREERWARRRPPLERLVVLALAAGSLLVVALVVLAVPPNMDEYVHYHPIACAAFPLAEEHVFRAGCDGRLDLRVLGAWLPLRSYRYAGSSTAAWYLPLYLLWPSRHGVRLLGVGSLVLLAAGVVRLVRLPWWVAWLLCASCLPVVFLLLFDTGPVGFQVALAAWAVVLLRYVLTAELGARSLATGALLGVLLFLGVEQKPFFVYQLPAIGFLGLVLARYDEARGAPRGLAPRLAALAPLAVVTSKAPGTGCTASIPRRSIRRRPPTGSRASSRPASRCAALRARGGSSASSPRALRRARGRSGSSTRTGWCGAGTTRSAPGPSCSRRSVSRCARSSTPGGGGTCSRSSRSRSACPARRSGSSGWRSERRQKLGPAGAARCAIRARQAPRSTCPARSPVSSPRSTVTAPLTITASIPSARVKSRGAPPGRS